MADLTLPMGTRIRYYRKRNGNRSIAAVAGLCGISERYLSLIENGQRTPSAQVLGRIARELGVGPSALLGDEQPRPEGVAAVSAVAPEVAGALMAYGGGRRTHVASAVVLRERVEAAWRIWQSSSARFTEIESVLPALIADTEHAVRAHRGAGEREVLRVAADLYGLLRSYCRRSGRLDLALMVADRGRRAAEDADDPVRIAAAEWNLAHCLLSQADGAQEADDVAARAIGDLADAGEGGQATAMRGALQLVRVVSAAQRRSWWEARERLAAHAAPLGPRAGRNVMWTVFGTVNVGLHALSIEMLAGQSSEGLRLADRVDLTKLPSRERQFTFTLELARCYDLRRDDAAVLVHLLALEELSAEDMRRSTPAIEMVTGLLHRVRSTYRRQVVDLAGRLDLV